MKKSIMKPPPQKKIKLIKGTVREVSIDPVFKDGNARFTTVPLKALYDQVTNNTLMFTISKTDNYQFWFLFKSNLGISTAGKTGRNYHEKNHF